MASKLGNIQRKKNKKKTRQGLSNNTKHGSPGKNGGNKHYKKKNRGQGR